MKVKLNDVIDRITGNVDRYNTELEYYVGGEHYECGRLAMYDKGLLDSEKGSTLGFKFHFPFQATDVLFMARNPHLKKAAMVMFDGICSDASYILRTKDESILLQRYIPLIIQNDNFWAFFEANKSGSVNYLMNWKEMKEYEFDLPDIKKQEELVELVWGIEETIAAYERLHAKTDELVKSQFIEMFADEAKRVRLDELCLHFGDGDWIESKDQSEEGIRLIQTGNVGNGEYKDKDDKARYISEETFIRLGCTEVFPGDILISRLPDPIGRACIVPEMPKSITAVDCTIVRLKADVLSTFFVNFTKTPMYTMQIDSFTTGSTRKRISRANLGSVMVPVPDLARQERFVSIAEQSDKSKFELRKAIENLKQMQRTIIKENV